MPTRKKQFGETLLAEIPARLTTEQAQAKRSIVGKNLSLSVRTSEKQSDKIRAAREELDKKGWPDNYVVCKNARDLGRIAREISLHKEFAYDCETSNLNPWTGDLYCTSIYVNGVSYLVNFAHPLLPLISFADFRRNLGNYFSAREVKRIGFNLNFDSHFIEEQAGIRVEGPFYDSELASWLIRSDLKPGVRALKPLCHMYLGIEKPGYSELYGSTAWIAGDPKLSSFYACGDAEMHYLLWKEYDKQLEKIPVVKKLHDDLEQKVHFEDYEEEREGFLLDEEYLRNELAPQLTKQVEELHAELVSLGMPPEMNPASPDQVATLLFDILKLPEISGRSTNKKVLDKLKSLHPIISKIPEFREASIFKNTFVDGLNDLMVKGRIHPNIRTIGSETGRSSCKKPNLYNMPIKAGPIIRKGFIAENDSIIIVSKDFKGQEFRIQADMCGPGKFYDVALKGTIYEETASTFWGGSPSDYKKDPNHPSYVKRAKSKIAVLALQYGAQAANLAETFECAKPRAQQFLDEYYKKFPELAVYQKNAKDFAKQNGYVQTVLGRRIHIDFSQCRDFMQMWALERNAINGPMQGTATDQIKLAYHLCKEYLKFHKKKTRCRFRIHDELIFYFDKEEFKDQQLQTDIDYIMSTCMPMKIPFEIETEMYGHRWGQKDED